MRRGRRATRRRGTIMPSRTWLAPVLVALLAPALLIPAATGQGGAAAGESVSPEMRGALAMLVMVLSVIVLLLMRRPVLARMGARNFVRRKGNTALVVGGLMVGTAIISASLVVGDTMDTFVSGFVLDALHTTDEVIAAEGPTGQDAFFSSVLYDEMETNISSLGTVDGGSPQIPGRISVLG